LRDESPLIAACCGRQVGKTTLAAIKALHFAISRSKVLVVIVSAGLRQSIILFGKIIDLTETAIPARLLLAYRTRTKVRFSNGSEIVALPCGRDGYTLRGFTSDMVILDECNFIPRGVIDSVVRPMMITRPKAKLIMASTPWVRDHPFYEAISKPELGFKTYTWPSSMSPLITPEKLEQERKTIGEYDFNREYNAAFIDDEFSYLPSNLVLNCTDAYELNGEPGPEEKFKGEYLIGVDFGKHADHSVIAILQKLDEELRLIYLHEFPLETSYASVIGTVRILNEAYAFEAGCLDQTGVGEAPYEEIRGFMRTMEGVTLTGPVKEDIMGKLKLAMEHGELTLPRDNSKLLVQMTNQQCQPTPAGALKFTHPAGTHDDCLWALALSVYANCETLPSGHLLPISRSFG
jgi:phage FluMu gp28-like protein